jgi:hypothetical protein
VHALPGDSLFREDPAAQAAAGPVRAPAARNSDSGLARQVTLVGSLPWAQLPTAAGGALPRGDIQGSGVAAGGASRLQLPREAGAAAPLPVVSDRRDTAGDELELPQLVGRWWERVVRTSPPFTVSLAAHVVLLLLLALWVIRAPVERRLRLELTFASTSIVDDESAGEPEVPVTVDEPEPETVVAEEPPTPEPEAAPTPVEQVVVDEGRGVEHAETPPPAVGRLLEGRDPSRREAFALAFGGSSETEAAVARALEWLAKHQQKDGLWSLQGPYRDGAVQENRLAATAMALLAFQGAGQTPTVGRHRDVVARGWKGLLARQLPDGLFDVTPMPSHHSLYAHAQATMALCEIYGMTRDPRFEPAATRAVRYAVAAQGPNGGWRYEPRQPGDMSVTGWFLMALKSAEMAGIEVPSIVFSEMGRFVDSVAVDDGTRYGYRFEAPVRPDDPQLGPAGRRPSPITAAVSAEGLLARQFLGWPRHDPRLRAGVEQLLAPPLFDFDRAKDVYAWYYITQVVHNLGGEPWDRWNASLREVLPARQVQGGGEVGSWDPGLDKWGTWGGRLFTTCFCTWMLEVYYRHLPLYDAMPPDEAMSPARARPLEP